MSPFGGLWDGCGAGRLDEMTDEPGEASAAGPPRSSRPGPAVLIALSAVIIVVVIAAIVVHGSGSNDSSGQAGNPATQSGQPTIPATPAGLGIQPGKTLSGVAGPDTGSAASFGAWRGKPVDVLVNYVGTKTWDGATQIQREGLLGGTAPGVHRVYSVPLIPSDANASLAQGAAGEYDAYFRTLAQQLVSGGEANATIRLGWEMTGTWFAWSGVANPGQWVGAYQKAVTAMRSVPGANFTFDWTEAFGFADPEPMYPGDAYVDLIGADVYDNSFDKNYPANDHVAVWNELKTQKWGLDWLSSFADAHHKRISLGEWGVSDRCDGHGGGDDPYFIQQMHDWIGQHNVAYEAYFNSSDSGVCASFALDSGKFPMASEAYKQLFGASTTLAAPTS